MDEQVDEQNARTRHSGRSSRGATAVDGGLDQETAGGRGPSGVPRVFPGPPPTRMFPEREADRRAVQTTSTPHGPGGDRETQPVGQDASRAQAAQAGSKRRPAGARRRDPIVQGTGLLSSSWLELRSDSIGHEVIRWRKEAETRLQRCGAGCDEEG